MRPATPPPALLEAFRAYERALMANDVEALDALFADSPDTLRGDAAGLLVGHDQISRFRSQRGGAPQRSLVSTHVRTIDADHALIVAVTELLEGGRGQQTQLWVRAAGRTTYDGWQVVAAHVSVPAPALDTRIWRVVGDPLAPATAHGALAGHTVAVKDIIALAGHPLGAGNPAWLAQARPEEADAWAIAALRQAGAAVRGIARTDEFAFSLSGTNAHYGTPPNPRAPFRASGGSSSGSASAVALGHASIGLGTDTGGSIRVPASYQGLWGMRPSHGAVPGTGVLPLAPTFDTVGWLTRDAATLSAVGEVLLPPSQARPLDDVVTVPTLTALADGEVTSALAAWSPHEVADAPWPELLAHLDEWLAAFQTVQAHEAWQSHGDWLAGRLDTLGPDVRPRFERARDTTATSAAAARATVAAARDTIRSWIGERALVLPAAASLAPVPGAAAAAREATLRLTCLAGLGGLPAVTIPIAPPGRLPVGACVLAGPGRDRDLLHLAARLAAI